MEFIKEDFNFKGIRITALVDEEGEPWFVAQEACAALELKNVSKALVELDLRDKKSVAGSKVGRNISKLRIINESGLYHLVFKSRKPVAKEFQDWVCDEVLPTIRKTGGYIDAPLEMTADEILARASEIARATIAKRQKLIDRTIEGALSE